MIPIIFLIIISVFVYRTARDNGYNAVLWTVATAVGFLVMQFAVGVGIGIVGLVLGWPATFVEDYGLLISFVALVPAFILVWLIWRHVNVIRDDGVEPLPPPPPPTFDAHE
ncbi:hypothetical protein BH10ACI2_BH10ACI2_12540 [soil metagenome]